MVTKEKILEEVSKMPINTLDEIYNYLKFIQFKSESSNKEWQKLGLEEFLKGYSEEDEVYNNL